MISLPSIAIKAKIYESANSFVYRGIREQDNTAVILKVLKEDYPTKSELTRYKQEYEITRSLNNIEGVIKAESQQEYQRTLIIILEDFGGKSLEKLMSESVGGYCPMPLLEFLRLAIKITEILGNIHAANVIHKDINPGNIVLNPETGIVKIIDFGISTRLPRSHPTLKNPNVLEGTLAYISPEQTGRMNRSLDDRTDFYGLGATFYELLTNKLPFETTDAIELVHCHIAKQPIPPYEVNSEIPQVVSGIVMKLLAKNAEDRYQSAWGIKADLEECLAQLQRSGTIIEFPLANKDISDKFQITQKLYGREREVQTLLAAFERVATPRSGEAEEAGGEGKIKSQAKIQNHATSLNGGNPPTGEPDASVGFPDCSAGLTAPRVATKSKIEMMLITGCSGVGKSALVQEFSKLITEKRGYFIWGKFDQFGHNSPYSAVVSAFQGLVRQLITETEAQLQQWREKILGVLGANVQVIIDIIPQVKLIVGKQPDVPKVGQTESENRFNRVFQNFIQVFCQEEHPLVIFLDDLQWADSSTLKLIELMLMDTNTQNLFLIGAYRDNEVNPTHSLMMMLEGLRKEETKINQITLAPLELEPITQLIADTLYSDTTSVKPLAELVVRKTLGNPLFVNEFLKMLYAENIITFNLPNNSVIEFDLNNLKSQMPNPKWSWHLIQIEATDITDNVVELIICKLNKLSNVLQKVLQLAACIGANFDLDTLSIISEKNRVEVFLDLLAAIKLGFILPACELDEELLIQNYKFLHDKIQQAAYTLIDDSQKQAIHLQIGRIFLQKTPTETLSNKLFEIVNHFNLGVVETQKFASAYISQQERNQIATLNLMAGQKAKNATAYDAAKRYLTTGIKLLAPNRWELNYDLTLALHEEAAEAAYLCGHFDEMERWVTVVLQRAKTLVDKIKVYEVKIQTNMAQTKLLEAVKIGLEMLELLGISLPQSPTALDIQQVRSETTASLTGKNIEDLSNLPVMTDAKKLAAMRILSSIAISTYVVAPALFPLLVCEQVNLSIKNGNAPESAFAYAFYGVILNEVRLSIW